MWVSEGAIPKADFLFRRTHNSLVDFKINKPKPKDFEDIDLSVDWNKYSTAEESIQRIKDIPHPKIPGKIRNPNDYFVCVLSAQKNLRRNSKFSD